MTKNSTVAILGFGKLGTVLSQLALRAGYNVFIAGSGDPDRIALGVSILAPGAIVATADDAIAQADIVILALPLGKFRTLQSEKFRGKLAIDAMNYWWEVDGKDSEFAQTTLSSSEIVQRYLQGARVVKALSHMGYHHLFDETRPFGTPGRKAIAIAGDTTADNTVVAKLIDHLGFDPVIIGPLVRGRLLQPGMELFGAHIGKEELQKILATYK